MPWPLKTSRMILELNVAQELTLLVRNAAKFNMSQSIILQWLNWPLRSGRNMLLTSCGGNVAGNALAISAVKVELRDQLRVTFVIRRQPPSSSVVAAASVVVSIKLLTIERHHIAAQREMML